MRGIAGIVHADPKYPIERELLRRMTSVMTSPRPDADELRVWQGAGLGHRRLSIIDLSKGDQPVFNEDLTYGVVLDGTRSRTPGSWPRWASRRPARS
jgi:asparagine synthase (glutamine-hydrolysing)